MARAGIAAVSAPVLLRNALPARSSGQPGQDPPTVLIAAGKASAAMAATFAELREHSLRRGVVCATHRHQELPSSLEWFQGGHPVPTDESVAAGRRALSLARSLRPPERLVVLLSGGASALLAVPAPGLTLEEKVAVTRALLAAGVQIHEMNTVRKHLSAVKGGWLAAVASGPSLTLAISDIVGPIEDDPSAIGSGPTVPDPTTFAEACRVMGDVTDPGMPARARRLLDRGARGELPETPKPGDRRLAHSQVRVIGSRRQAMAGAVEAARRLGYGVVTIEAAVTGEARVAGARHATRVLEVASRAPRPLCVISSGETTVTVKGAGRGGRNQEFALAFARALAGRAVPLALASVGTDGIDGPTDAAGALVDGSTIDRAAAAGIGAPEDYLARNDTYRFFEALGDLVKLGPTDTNVGDLQVALVAEQGFGV